MALDEFFKYVRENTAKPYVIAIAWKNNLANTMGRNMMELPHVIRP